MSAVRQWSWQHWTLSGEQWNDQDRRWLKWGGGHYSAECGLRRAGHVSSHNTAHHGFRALRGGDSGAGSNSTHESQIEPCRPLGARSLTVSIEYMWWDALSQTLSRVKPRACVKQHSGWHISLVYCWEKRYCAVTAVFRRPPFLSGVCTHTHTDTHILYHHTEITRFTTNTLLLYLQLLCY